MTTHTFSIIIINHDCTNRLILILVSLRPLFILSSLYLLVIMQHFAPKLCKVWCYIWNTCKVWYYIRDIWHHLLMHFGGLVSLLEMSLDNPKNRVKSIFSHLPRIWGFFLKIHVLALFLSLSKTWIVMLFWAYIFSSKLIIKKVCPRLWILIRLTFIL